MKFPDHNGQETTHIQQVPDVNFVCVCGGPIEDMGGPLIFIHHAESCPRVAAWLERCKVLSANRHNFKEYGHA